MEAIIVSYRRGVNTQTDSQMILKVSGVDARKDTPKLIGKKVVWQAPGKKATQIAGIVSAAHGNSGAVRVKFERGMPGQALGQKVRVE